MLLIEYPKCSTCRKAKAFLQNHGAAFESRHIVDHPPTAAELDACSAGAACHCPGFSTPAARLTAVWASRRRCPPWIGSSSWPYWPPTACSSSAPCSWGRALCWWVSGRLIGWSGCSGGRQVGWNAAMVRGRAGCMGHALGAKAGPPQPF